MTSYNVYQALIPAVWRHNVYQDVIPVVWRHIMLTRLWFQQYDVIMFTKLWFQQYDVIMCIRLWFQQYDVIMFTGLWFQQYNVIMFTMLWWCLLQVGMWAWHAMNQMLRNDRNTLQTTAAFLWGVSSCFFKCCVLHSVRCVNVQLLLKYFCKLLWSLPLLLVTVFSLSRDHRYQCWRFTSRLHNSRPVDRLPDVQIWKVMLTDGNIYLPRHLVIIYW